MTNHTNKRDQVLGCLLGGALGDAWGGPWEGSSGRIAFQIPSQSFISDDTQLTLATCESLIANRGVDAERLASHFAAWFSTGRIRGIGASTLKAMRELVAGVHWGSAGSKGEFAAGNGAAMRIAPLAFLLDPAKSADRTVIRDVCRITHCNDEAYVGALAVVIAIRSILDRTWSRDKTFLSIVAESVPDSAVRDRVIDLLPLRVPPFEVAARFGAGGWVVDTVPLALYCAQFIVKQPVPTVLALAIEGGGDTDTIASITGQIAGAASGLAPDCQEHFSRLAEGGEVIRAAENFADFLQEREVGTAQAG